MAQVAAGRSAAGSRASASCAWISPRLLAQCALRTRARSWPPRPCARHRHARQAALAGIGVVVLELRQRCHQIVEAGHRGRGGGGVFPHGHRMGKLFQHDGAAFKHAFDRRPRLRLAQAGVGIGQRQQLQAHAVAQLGNDAEALHRDCARTVLAMQHDHGIEHFLRGRRRRAGFRALPRNAGQLPHQLCQCKALGPVTLQGPCSQRQQDLQHAAGKDQQRNAWRLRHWQAHVGADHQQDHAGQAHPGRHRAQCDQQAAAQAEQQPGEHQGGGVVADPDAQQRGATGRQRRHQHALQACPIRAGLIGKHGVQCTAAHRQAGRNMPRRHADQQRQHHRGGIAQRNAHWHVARLEVDQCAQHGVEVSRNKMVGRCGCNRRPAAQASMAA